MLTKIFMRENVPTETIDLADVEEGYQPIFAKRNGKLVGMMVKSDAGWIIRIGGSGGATGFHPTLAGCMRSALKHDYEFFVDL